MPLLLWPFPSGVPAPPTPLPRFLSGKIVIINAVEYTPPIFAFNAPPTYQAPKLGESCAILVYVGGGLPTAAAPVLFTFIRPDGSVYAGEPEFAFIGMPGASYYYNMPSGQYVVYLTAAGELNQIGPWQVSVATTNFVSGYFSFMVVPY
jgi:hypothetical protein